MKYQVIMTKSAEKDVIKIPFHIVRKLEYWVAGVEKYGIEKMRKIPGYHDEPLYGERKGQRSIRLSKSYRAIYEEKKTKEIRLILIMEVNKHEY